MTNTLHRRHRWTLVLAVLLAVGIVAAAGFELLTPPARSSASPSLTAGPSGTSSGSDLGAVPVLDPGPSGSGGLLGAEDGLVPDGATVLDRDLPAVARLDAALLDALLRAAAEAREDGTSFAVSSGWRSPGHQQQLLRDAITTYGSAEEASRWVSTPETSAHVSGDAVDMGTAAATWLSRHGSRYGLCQVYANEPWHYELRPTAVDRGCPAMYDDPSEDPRMR